MSNQLFRALFQPQAVALIGASGDEAKASSRPQRYLIKHGYRGKIYPINPTRSEIFGLPAFPRVAALPGPVDHAYVVAPSREVPQVIADCAAAGIRVVSVFSDGFADVGPEGRARQDALVRDAQAAGMRILGPNSMGVIDAVEGMSLTVNAVMDGVELMKGPMGLVSQSGAMIGSLLARAQARGLGFSRLVSVGNEADLSVGEIVDLMVDDAHTRQILLFLETLRDPERLAAAARRAYQAGKPVIAYKLGRSEAGRGLAAAHSGALAGPRENVTAFFRRHGIMEVEFLESLLESPMLAGSGRPPGGRKVAVLTNTGGGAAVVADRLGALGLDLMPAPEALVKRIAADHRIRVAHGPIIDVTAAGTSKEIYGAALEELVKSDCDAIVVIIGSSGMFNPQYAVAPILGAIGRGKAIASFVLPEAPQTMRMLVDSGVAAFRTPEACADSVAAYLNWKAPRAIPSVAAASIKAASAQLAAADGPVLNEERSRAVFEALGVAQARAKLVKSAAGARALDLAFPVAAKIVSADIPHKTEAGGVVLRIPDRAALEREIDALLARIRAAHPNAAIDGVLVQEMQSGLAETILGFKRDPEVGPIVMIGLGGVLAEIYSDVAIRLAPVDRSEALEMIAEVRGLAPIRGYRNLPPGDCAALAEAIAAFSQLAAVSSPVISEAEINPLIVKADGAGVAAVDGLIVLAGATPAAH